MIDKKRKGYLTQEQQAEADKRWAENNRKHRTYLSARGTARSFIRNHATKDDLVELKQIIQKKEEEL